MKYLFLYITLFSVSLSFAQLQHNITLETASGYDYNIFKAPDVFLDNGVLKEKDALYKSSFFQSARVRLFIKKQWKQQSLSFRFHPKGIYYFSESPSSYFSFSGGLRYRYQFHRKTEWHVAGSFKLKNRDGINIDGSALNFPLGNNHYAISTGLDFRLYKQNRSRLKFTYAYRDYKDTPKSELSYHAIRLEGTFRNVFKRPAGWHSYGLQWEGLKKFFSQGLATAPSTFTWTEVSAEAFYRYPISKALNIKPAFGSKMRWDSHADKFSYQQIKPSLTLQYNSTRLQFELKGNYIQRWYKTLKATNSQNEVLGRLKQQYLQFKLDTEYRLDRFWSLTFKGYFNQRTSNKTNINTIFFRGFDYYNGAIGLKYRF